MAKMQDIRDYCRECGVRIEACDCGGEGKDAQAKVEAEWEAMRGAKKAKR